MVDLKMGNCANHPLYNAALSPYIQWKKCQACHHIFTAGYYTEAACALIFSKTNETQSVGYGMEQNRVISSRMVEKVLPYAAEGIWLDVGFGNASLLLTAQEYGFTPVGLDVRKTNVDQLKSLGIAAYSADLTQVELPQPCAVISMADVLEHIPYPQTALAAASRLLQTGGALLISMPNTENALWQAMDNQNLNPYWGEMEHFHNFSRTGLYALLRSHGFEPVRYGISERYRVCMEVVAVKR
jgi:ubiquinone/menaquinone biosynthesis C-methylase UbiE